MRTKGLIETTGVAIHDIVTIVTRTGASTSTVARTMSETAKGDAAHIVATWNAIETHCGGKPAVVQELVDRLRQDQAVLASVALGIVTCADKKLLCETLDEAKGLIDALLAKLPEAKP